MEAKENQVIQIARGISLILKASLTNFRQLPQPNLCNRIQPTASNVTTKASAPPFETQSSVHASPSNTDPLPPIYFNDFQNQQSIESTPLSHPETNTIKDKDEHTHSAINTEQIDTPSEERKIQFRERKIPSSPTARMLGFTGLGLQLAYGTASKYMKRKLFGKEEHHHSEKEHQVSHQKLHHNTTKQEHDATKITQPVSKEIHTSTSAPPSTQIPTPVTNTTSDLRYALISEENAEKLAAALCRMRGAALKLGQILSIQDESLVPKPFLVALERARSQADIMPRKQFERQMNTELGQGWKEKYFNEFDMMPIAAASIGQVHKGVLKDGRTVAVKVQYPGVAESIDSDIKNVMRLVNYTNFLPDGAFLEQTMNQARKELKLECDYTNESANQKKFKQFIQQYGMKDFEIPDIIDELTTTRVLTSTFLPAGCKSIEELSKSGTQEQRNHVAKLILEMCLRELFDFRYMQTDPNWSNFYYHPASKKLYLIDFGACLEFPKKFIDEYLRVVYASAIRDKETILDASRKMGFLTGEESSLMNDAHTETAIAVGEPFSKPGIYDFEHQLMTKRVQGVIPTMLKHRLTAPPPVTYSLHRKLSGAFLICYKLRAHIECRSMFMEIYNRYEFDDKSYKKE